VVDEVWYSTVPSFVSSFFVPFCFYVSHSLLSTYLPTYFVLLFVSLATVAIPTIPEYNGLRRNPKSAPEWSVAIVDPAFLPLWLLMGEVKVVGEVNAMGEVKVDGVKVADDVTLDNVLPTSSVFYKTAKGFVDFLKEGLHNRLRPFVITDNNVGGLAATRMKVSPLELTFTTQVASVVSEFVASTSTLYVLPPLTVQGLNTTKSTKDESGDDNSSVTKASSARVAKSDSDRKGQHSSMSTPQEASNDQGIGTGKCTPSYLHQAPVLTNSFSDVLCGFHCGGHWFPTAVCEPGDKDKTLQLYRYVHNAMRAYVGYPTHAPSLVGLRSSNPLNFGTIAEPLNAMNLAVDAFVFRDGVVGRINLFNQKYSRGPEPTGADNCLGWHCELYARFFLGAWCHMATIVNRLKQRAYPVSLGRNVILSEDGVLVYKWFRNSVSRKANVDYWEKFSRSLLVGAFVSVSEPSAVWVLVTKYVKPPTTVKVGHFITLLETLRQMVDEKVVHGDIRAANIVFDSPKSELGPFLAWFIDFDFAGPAGGRCYPKGLNMKINDGKRGFEAPESPDRIELQNWHDVYALGSVLELFSVDGSKDAAGAAAVRQVALTLLKCKSDGDASSSVESALSALQQHKTCALKWCSRERPWQQPGAATNSPNK